MPDRPEALRHSNQQLIRPRIHMTQVFPSSVAVLASQGSFSGHETFTLRYGWLKSRAAAMGDLPGSLNNAAASIQNSLRSTPGSEFARIDIELNARNKRMEWWTA